MYIDIYVPTVTQTSIFISCARKSFTFFFHCGQMFYYYLLFDFMFFQNMLSDLSMIFGTIQAKVGKKFLERFENHQWAARMAFRIGQSYYKMEDYTKAAGAFEEFAKTFPDDELCADALFWGGESYRMAKNIPKAFRFYNRCRWDFASSDAAKYALGRLALPEMLAQFEREANLENQ